MQSIDLEKLNRDNFKALMDVLSMPGSQKEIEPLQDSALLAIANVLLYSEVHYHNLSSEDLLLIETVTNSQVENIESADYIFSDDIKIEIIEKAKKGDYLNPDFSATIICKCSTDDQTKVRLSGPGIDGSKETVLPLKKDICEALMEKNSDYPLGIECFFLSQDKFVRALSRTTKVEVL